MLNLYIYLGTAGIFTDTELSCAEEQAASPLTPVYLLCDSREDWREGFGS